MSTSFWIKPLKSKWFHPLFQTGTFLKAVVLNVTLKLTADDGWLFNLQLESRCWSHSAEVTGNKSTRAFHVPRCCQLLEIDSSKVG